MRPVTSERFISTFQQQYFKTTCDYMPRPSQGGGYTAMLLCIWTRNYHGERRAARCAVSTLFVSYHSSGTVGER